MLQRIQTVYLFTAIALTFAFAFLQIEKIMAFDISGVPGISALISGLLSLIALVMFSNRGLQLKLVLLAIFVLLCALGFYIYLNLNQNFYTQTEFYLLLLALVNNVLARRGVKKDEELIRSSNRLR